MNGRMVYIRIESGIASFSGSVISDRLPLASALEISVLKLMRSEQIIRSEVSREESADIIIDTLNIAKLQRKHEQKIAMMRVLLPHFAGTNILYAIGKGDHILQMICIVCILVIAVIMSVVKVGKTQNMIL